MGKKKIEHIVFDGVRKQKLSIPFKKVNQKVPEKRKIPRAAEKRRPVMYKRILFALDLEGVNFTVGEPYSGLGQQSACWEKARRQAALEVNAAADALFAAGAEKVDLWDNHAGGHNVDPEDLDTRINLLDPDLSLPRMYFAAEHAYDCICFFGYHAMEGTLGGVLAHTMNSKEVQFYKLNGKYIGEVDMDAYIAASHDMPSVSFVGGDIACKQASCSVPDIVTVATKHELSRNAAEFRENEELFSDIRREIVRAVSGKASYAALSFPAVFEKSFKRVEDAAKHLEKMLEKGIAAEYLKDDVLLHDAHTVVSTVYSIEEFIAAI